MKPTVICCHNCDMCNNKIGTISCILDVYIWSWFLKIFNIFFKGFIHFVCGICYLNIMIGEIIDLF